MLMDKSSRLKRLAQVARILITRRQKEKLVAILHPEIVIGITTEKTDGYRSRTT